jgi:hypothetical protein
MYQKDYLLRMIAMIIKALAELFGLIEKGELKKAAEELESSYTTFLKEDAIFFRNIPAARITDVLLHEHNYTSSHVEILAELFNAEGVLRLAQGDKAGSHEFSEKSLMLFEFIDREYKTYSEERIRKMDEIKKRIRELQ